MALILDTACNNQSLAFISTIHWDPKLTFKAQLLEYS